MLRRNANHPGRDAVMAYVDVDHSAPRNASSLAPVHARETPGPESRRRSSARSETVGKTSYDDGQPDTPCTQRSDGATRTPLASFSVAGTSTCIRSIVIGSVSPLSIHSPRPAV